MNGYPIYYDWLPQYSVFIPYVPYTTPFTNLVSLPCFSTHASNPIPTSGAQNLGDLGVKRWKVIDIIYILLYIVIDDSNPYSSL